MKLWLNPIGVLFALVIIMGLFSAIGFESVAKFFLDAACVVAVIIAALAMMGGF